MLPHQPNGWVAAWKYGQVRDEAGSPPAAVVRNTLKPMRMRRTLTTRGNKSRRKSRDSSDSGRRTRSVVTGVRWEYCAGEYRRFLSQKPPLSDRPDQSINGNEATTGIAGK